MISETKLTRIKSVTKMEKIFNLTKRYIYWIFLAIVLAILFSNQEYIVVLARTTINDVVLLTTFRLAILILNSYFLLRTLVVFDKAISLTKSFEITVISSLSSLILPMQAGIGVRALILKKEYGLKYTHYTASLIGYYVLFLGVNTIIGTSAMIIIGDTKSIVFGSMIGVLIIIAFIIIAPSLTGSILLRMQDRFQSYYLRMFINKAIELLNGWIVIISNKSLVLWLLLITLLIFFFTLLTYSVIFSVATIEVNLASLALFTAISNLSLLIGLTPGSIGIKEGVQLLVLIILGISTEAIIHITLLDRSSQILTLLLCYLLLFAIKQTNAGYKSFFSRK